MPTVCKAQCGLSKERFSRAPTDLRSKCERCAKELRALVTSSGALLLGINNLRRTRCSFSGEDRLVREQLFPSCSPTAFWFSASADFSSHYARLATITGTAFGAATNVTRREYRMRRLVSIVENCCDTERSVPVWNTSRSSKQDSPAWTSLEDRAWAFDSAFQRPRIPNTDKLIAK